jgi:hypothetical protein
LGEHPASMSTVMSVISMELMFMLVPCVMYSASRNQLAIEHSGIASPY